MGRGINVRPLFNSRSWSVERVSSCDKFRMLELGSVGMGVVVVAGFRDGYWEGFCVCVMCVWSEL